MNVLKVCGVLIGAYIIGSFPTGFYIARMAGVEDIRQYGSGNIGATNVGRVLGARFFPLIFFLDALKAYIPLAISAYMGSSIAMQCLVAGTLFAGNICSIFLAGSGGKGVATAVGILAALAPLSVIPACGVFLLILAITRTVGIASMAAAASLPFVCWYLQVPILVNKLVVLMSGVIIVRHANNIRAYWGL